VTETDQQIEAELSALGCTDLSDAMDRLRIPGQLAGIMPLDRGFTLTGRAWTLRYGPVGQDPGTVGDYIDDLGPGQVVVLDNQARLDATVWGDLLTTVAAGRHVAGTVIDGVCRDVSRALSVGYPVFSRGNWMRTGKDRVRVESTAEPVTAGGIRVEPGDWMRGDADGVVSVPASRVREVIAAAREIAAAEERIRKAVLHGQSLREARRDNAYHSLQSARGRLPAFRPAARPSRGLRRRLRVAAPAPGRPSRAISGGEVSDNYTRLRCQVQC
jgi:4-hydroxy-4-methyl-2-oxoglutarate aldolase